MSGAGGRAVSKIVDGVVSRILRSVVGTGACGTVISVIIVGVVETIVASVVIIHCEHFCWQHQT
jgi:hypothetical protein